MSADGTMARATSRRPSGMCYRVLMWEEGALPEEALEAWQTARAGLLKRMRDAGARRARGELARLSEELRTLTANAVEAPLMRLGEGGFPLARVEALVPTLQGDSAVRAYRLRPGFLDVLLELVEGEGVDVHLTRWRDATPELAWCACPVVQMLPLAESLAFQESCGEEEMGRQEEDDDASPARPFHHVTVMAREAVEALQPAAGRVFVDATLGGGGHSELLLQAGATVWGIDQDPEARRAARARLAPFGERLHVLAGNFRQVTELLEKHGVTEVDGLLADIGISSPQVDCPERGFSFLHDGPLDMRMNPSAPRSAADIVNQAEEKELADILWQYGEERASRTLARRLVQERSKAPIATTARLADIITSVLPRKGKQHPATRSFQALRIAVNDELGALEDFLHQGIRLLRSGGRLGVITFHSLEDRIVKRFFERISRPEIDRPEWPAPRPNPDYCARLVFRKPLSASPAEREANPRSRSARLRVVEKI